MSTEDDTYLRCLMTSDDVNLSRYVMSREDDQWTRCLVTSKGGPLTKISDDQ